MGTFDALLAQIASPEDVQLAKFMAAEDQHLIVNLIKVREKLGISQSELARRLNVSQAAISSFERAGNDPHLSTIRRYARALGVLVLHKVDEAPNLSCESHELWHLTGDGINSSPTAQSAFRNSRQASSWPAEATATTPVRTTPVRRALAGAS